MKNGIYLRPWYKGGFMVLYVDNNKVYAVDTRQQRVILREETGGTSYVKGTWWQRWAIDFKDFKAKLLEAVGATADPFAWEKSFDGTRFIRIASHRDLARLKVARESRRRKS